MVMMMCVYTAYTQMCMYVLAFYKNTYPIESNRRNLNKSDIYILNENKS